MIDRSMNSFAFIGMYSPNENYWEAHFPLGFNSGYKTTFTKALTIFLNAHFIP